MIKINRVYAKAAKEDGWTGYPPFSFGAKDEEQNQAVVPARYTEAAIKHTL
jgi:hypothetical protein